MHVSEWQRQCRMSDAECPISNGRRRQLPAPEGRNANSQGLSLLVHESEIQEHRAGGRNGEAKIGSMQVAGMAKAMSNIERKQAAS